MNQLKKKIIIRAIILLIIILIIISIILLKNFYVNKTNLEEINYKNVLLNLYVLNDGTLRVEENIKLDKNKYSTYFLVDNKYNEIEYKHNVEKLKVYYNNIELDTDKDNINGYYIYKYNDNILNSKEVELRVSKYNNIEVFLPNCESNLKIVYELKDYIANYNDISYFQFNLKYGFNIFQNGTQINIIMPSNTEIFDIYNNIEFSKKRIIKNISSYKKELYYTGLREEDLHLDVIFNKDIVDSKLKINEDKHLDIVEKYNKIKKSNLKFYIILFGLLIVLPIFSGISTTIKYWNIENRERISLGERHKVKWHYLKIMFVLLALVLIVYTIIRII